jgi:hypothetical protein
MAPKPKVPTFEELLAASGANAASVYTGKGGEQLSVQDWGKRWWTLDADTKRSYISRFQQAGYKVTDEYQAFAVWQKYGEASARYGQYDQKVAPDTLIGLDASRGAAKGGSTGPAFTREDGKAYAQGTYNSLLGRDAVGGELDRAISAATGMGKDVGAAGRQQAVVDAVKSTDEFKNRQENRYLDALYSELARDMQRTR